MMTSTKALTQEDITFICDLAQQAGDLAVSMRDSVGIREKTGPYDLITDADLALSELIVRELKQRFVHDFIISEEEVPDEQLQNHLLQKEHRTWLVDPIDGTDNYVNGDGQYAVMIGLLINGSAEFGCIYSPKIQTVYYGGPTFGSWKRRNGSAPEQCLPAHKNLDSPVRLMIGWRDGKNHPWVKKLDGIKYIPSGSVGLRVAKIIEDEADIYVHLSGKLKLWDTAGPVAIALAAGLEVGTLESDSLSFLLPEVKHKTPVVIGRHGTLAWSRKVITQSLIL